MNSIVCVKRVLDPALPPGKFVIDAEEKRVVPPQGIPQIMNPYDAHALELALRLKAANGGRVTALSLEASDSDEIVRHAIAMGADEGILLHDVAFEGLSSFGTASALTKAIEKIGDYQLILCGREAVDWDEGLVGPFIADNLGLPLITLAMEAALINAKLRVKRVTLDGYQVFDAALPAVVTVSNEVGNRACRRAWGSSLLPVESLPSGPLRIRVASRRREKERDEKGSRDFSRRSRAGHVNS